ncbi:hypothetical protein HK098_004272 [Nowakowskiella sp. JEL0407]|nr:hypothetical protein HK098_004272 [Nowakowskiella sp. JEL0407]
MPFLPGPCLHNNDDFVHKRTGLKVYSEREIGGRRRQWQSFLLHEFPKPTNSFEFASRHLGNNGLREFNGRGIVMTVGIPKHFHVLKANIQILRKNGCDLPIEIWCFEDEFNEDMRQLILKNAQVGVEDDVQLRFADDKRNFLPLDRGTGPGFHIKYAAIINSGFEEIIFLDVDAFTVKNPEYLFTSNEYLTHGALFWPDYWKTAKHSPIWSWMGQPCVDEWEQESGIMVINKRQSWKALMLLWFINKDNESRAWNQKFLHGDKDLFRFSWRAAGTPAYFIQHHLSPAGFIHPSLHRFCGMAMIQYDISGDILIGHMNLFKHGSKTIFNSTHTPIKYLKRFKKLEDLEPPGPKPNTRLSFAMSRGERAGVYIKDGYICVDIGNSEHDGLNRETEMIHFNSVAKQFEEDINNYLMKDWIARDAAVPHKNS